MTLLDTYNGFIGALATWQPDLLPTFVDPGACTETCVGLALPRAVTRCRA